MQITFQKAKQKIEHLPQFRRARRPFLDFEAGYIYVFPQVRGVIAYAAELTVVVPVGARPYAYYKLTTRTLTGKDEQQPPKDVQPELIAAVQALLVEIRMAGLPLDRLDDESDVDVHPGKAEG